MTGERALRGAIVGCGIVTGLSHLPAWRAQRGAVIVALCDRDEEAAQDMARRYGIRSVYDDQAQMLREESLDFVDICTPPSTHPGLALQAMEAGLHVLVEKPMAVTAAEADEMVSASEAHGAMLCVMHSHLFTRPLRKAKRLVAEGAIGDVVSVTSDKLFPQDGAVADSSFWAHRLPGGIFGEYAPHQMYLQLAFIGGVRSVSALASKRSGFAWVVGDELRVTLEGEAATGSFALSCNCRGPLFTLTIAGTEGRIEIDNYALTMTRRSYRGNGVHQFAASHLEIAGQYAIEAGSTVLMALGRRKWYDDGHRSIIEGFVRSMRTGKGLPVTAREGAETVRALEEVWTQIGMGGNIRLANVVNGERARLPSL
jgi:predicted dehydrogenase